MEQRKAKKLIVLEAGKWCQNCAYYKESKCLKVNDWRPRKMTCTEHVSRDAR